MTQQTGARAYGPIERKRRRRLRRRAQKAKVSARRRQQARDEARALRAKGFLK